MYRSAVVIKGVELFHWRVPLICGRKSRAKMTGGLALFPLLRRCLAQDHNNLLGSELYQKFRNVDLTVHFCQF